MVSKNISSPLSLSLSLSLCLCSLSGRPMACALRRLPSLSVCSLCSGLVSRYTLDGLQDYPLRLHDYIPSGYSIFCRSCFLSRCVVHVASSLCSSRRPCRICVCVCVYVCVCVQISVYNHTVVLTHGFLIVGYIGLGLGVRVSVWVVG